MPLRRKPGWESRDPAERARAVAQAPADAFDAAALTELVRTDPAPDVRRAALRRLEDLALLADRMRHDDDAGVRDAARARYRELLVDATRPVAERERVLRVEDDQDVLAHVATRAAESELRRLALERTSRAGLVAERCQRDPDPAIRRWLLERIDAPATLERIAESARRSDKQLAREARDRLESLRLAAGDPATLRARAMALCEALDALRRERPADLETRRATHAAEWATLRERVDSALARRVDGYFAMLEPRAEPASIPIEAVAPADADPIEESPPPPEPDPAEVAAAAAAAEAERERAAEAEARERASAEQAAMRAAEREARQSAREALAAAVDALAQAVADGRIATARPAHARIADLRTAAEPLPRDLAARLAEIEAEFDKLARWQRWSNNKVRSRICAEIDALPASGLHPDAVAAKVREAQVEWQRLDESEQLADRAADTGIAKRFRIGCHRALAPTRKYFEKRRELRDTKREAVETLVAEVDAVLVADPGAAPALRRRVVDALQRLDELDPKVRGEEGRKLRALLARFDALRGERESAAEAAKRKLVANLRRELARAPLEEAIEKSKAAQSEWKRIGSAGRTLDAELDAELRTLVDPVFEKAGAARSADDAARREREAEARAILDELAALADDPLQAAHGDTRVAALTQRWRALPRERADAGGRDSRDSRDARRPSGPRGRDDRGGFGRSDRTDRSGRTERGRDRATAGPRDTYDERAFDRALDRVRDAQRAAARAGELAALSGLREAAALCARVEDGECPDLDAARAAFDALALPADARDAMRARLDAAIARDFGDDAAAINADEGERLAVRAELVADRPSPEASKPLRRQLQLERLAARMQGGLANEARVELREILIEWCTLGPVAREVRDALDARIAAAVEAAG